MSQASWPEGSEADLAEQHALVDAEPDDEPAALAERPDEADEADVAEQRQEVSLAEDDYEQSQ